METIPKKTRKITSKTNSLFSDELKVVFTGITKLSVDCLTAKSRLTQVGDDYKKCLKEIQRLQKDNEDKGSKIKQQDAEISHLNDIVSIQKEKIQSLTKDDSELSFYRNSSNSINSIELNNEMFVKKYQ